jgi:hypothetical protein
MAFESGFRTTLAKPLAPTSTTMFLAQVPTVTEGRLFLDNWAQQERIEFNWVSWTTVTNLKRGMSKTADPSTEWTGLTWLAGTRVRLVAMHDQITDKQELLSGNNVWTGENTFNDVNINNATIQNFIVEWQVKLLPVVADEAARDVLYPAPEWGNAVYVQSLNAMQIYNESTVQWESLAVWTPTPEATETVKGIARFATGAEALAGTNDKTIMTPAKTKSITTTIIESEASVLSNQDYIAWEDIAEWDSLFREDPVTFAQATTDQLIGDVAGNTRVSIRAIGSWVAGNSLKLALAKVDNLWVDLLVRVEKDDAGKPSGELIDANATATVARADLTTSLADTNIAFGWVSVNNEHWVTLDSTEASQTLYKWVKLTITTQVSMITVVKDSDCTATKCYLYNTAGLLLTSASFVAQTATLNYWLLVNGDSYYVLAGSDGSSYTSVKQTGSASYPYSKDKLDYISWWILSTLWATASRVSWWSADVGGGRTNIISVTATKDCKITSAINTQWTKATQLQNSNWELIETSTTGSFNTKLTAGAWYRLLFTGIISDGWPYDTLTWRTDLSFVSTIYADRFSITTIWVGIDESNINNIANITTSDTFIIPRVPVHIVLAQASDTVDAARHFKLWHIARNTTTRGLNLWNATRWTINNDKFAYVSSGLFESSLLSKTSALYTYKLPDIPRISTGAYTTGQLVKYDFDGITKRLSGLTRNRNYFISNTPWTISLTWWTNKIFIWEWMSDWLKLNLYPTIMKAISATENTAYLIRWTWIATYTINIYYWSNATRTTAIQVSNDWINWITEKEWVQWNTGYPGAPATATYTRTNFLRNNIYVRIYYTWTGSASYTSWTINAYTI